MPLYGLDVSEHNNGLNLHTAQQEGYDFAIIRICDGTYKDPIFNSHLNDAKQQDSSPADTGTSAPPPKAPPSPNKSTPSTNNYKAAKTSPSG